MWYRTPSLLRNLYPSLTWKRDITDKVIYLTFDDGPIPELTPFVLNELDKASAKATFFCVGENLVKHADIAQQVIKRGHRIANHSHNHLNGWKTKNSDYLSNVQLCEDTIKKLGVSNTFYRPPYGKIKTGQIQNLKHRYEIIMWDVLSKDYDKSVSPETCLYNSIENTCPGTIIVFHDNLKASDNLKYVLPKYIQHFANNGYQFKTL